MCQASADISSGETFSGINNSLKKWSDAESAVSAALSSELDGSGSLGSFADIKDAAGSKGDRYLQPCQV